MEELIKAVKSLLSDIESMKGAEPNWFGFFSTAADEYDGSLENVAIEWPNLAISAEEVKKIIVEHEKVLVIDHQQALEEHHQKALGHDGEY